MTEEIRASEVPDDTGPLKWSAEKHSRAQYVASIVLVVALLAITGMLVAYGNWGRP